MKEKINKKELVSILIIILIQTIVFVIAGINKSYIHMDEAYSLGLASYNKTEIQANEDFYNTWHNGEYYEDYLAVNDNEKGEYSQVYENQKNDVHPPLYYLLLRFAMGFSLNEYSKWPGIILNIIIYAFITTFTYLIMKKLLFEKEKSKEISLVIALMSSLTLAAITNAIYIRMYSLSALNIVITSYLHMKLLDSKKPSYKLLICIGISALIGSLTHYYYLFYLGIIFVMFAIKYISKKQYKDLIKYVLTFVLAGITSLLIFPHSITHMFFGYRGQGAISNLTSVSSFITSIRLYIEKIKVFGFNNLLYAILVIMLALIIYKKMNKIKLIESKNKYIKYIVLPTVVYFILTSIASPWIELRYIMPICGIVYIIIMYYIVDLLHNVMSKNAVHKTIIITSILIFIMPIILGILNKTVDTADFRSEPEVMYSNRKEIVEKLTNELKVPVVYMFNSGHNRFLDDILLFSIIEESYIAKDIDYTEENIKNILEGKDISNGIVVFINENQDNDKILTQIKNALNFENTTWLHRLNACDVYYMQ